MIFCIKRGFYKTHFRKAGKRKALYIKTNAPDEVACNCPLRAAEATAKDLVLEYERLKSIVMKLFLRESCTMKPLLLSSGVSNGKASPPSFYRYARISNLLQKKYPPENQAGEG